MVAVVACFAEVARVTVRRWIRIAPARRDQSTLVTCSRATSGVAKATRIIRQSALSSAYSVSLACLPHVGNGENRPGIARAPSSLRFARFAVAFPSTGWYSRCCPDICKLRTVRSVPRAFSAPRAM